MLKSIFSGAAALILGAPFMCISAFAQDAVAVHLAQDVVPAPAGYVAATAHYVAAHATAVYISPFIWAGKVLNNPLKPDAPVDVLTLKAGQALDVLAKPKGYDWLLVGKGGVGIGYVPVSAVTEAKR